MERTKITHRAFYVLSVILLMIVTNILGGCSLIWTDDIFLCTWFKEVDAANIEMISEPNYLQMGSGILRSKSKSIKIVTPSGTIGIGD